MSQVKINVNENKILYDSIDTLIGQNESLLKKLREAANKIVELERFRSENESLQEQVDSLKSQIEILRKKDKTISNQPEEDKKYLDDYHCPHIEPYTVSYDREPRDHYFYCNSGSGDCYKKFYNTTAEPKFWSVEGGIQY